MLYLHKCQHFFHFFYTEKELMRDLVVVLVIKISMGGFFDSLNCIVEFTKINKADKIYSIEILLVKKSDS